MSDTKEISVLLSRDNGIFIVLTGIIIACGRILFDEKQADDILIVMAIINYVALGFVLLFLHIKILDNCYSRIVSAGVDTNEKKSRKKVLNICSFIFFLIYLLAGSLYITVFKSAKFNDAISIFALALSIATDNITIGLSDSFYRLIVNISKYKKLKHREQEG